MEQEKILLQIETELVALRTFIRKLKHDAKLHQLDIDLIKQKARSMYDSVLLLQPTSAATPRATVFDIKKPEPAEVPEEELLGLRPINRNFRVHHMKINFSSDGKPFRLDAPAPAPKEISLKMLRHLFNKRDIRGVRIIEELTEKTQDEREHESFIYELLYIMKRSSFRSKEEITYLNHAIAALSRLRIPEGLFNKVLEEMSQKAFNWLLPIETKLNILYFCYRFSNRIKDERLRTFPPLFLSYIRNKKLSEGEDELPIITMLLDDYYQKMQHKFVPKIESKPKREKKPYKKKSGSNRGRSQNRRPRRR